MVGINDHVPVPVGTAIMMTTNQLDEIKEFLFDLHAKQLGLAPAVLSADQFDKLVELLQPGYELSSLMLADYKVRAAQTANLAATELTKPKDPAPAPQPPETPVAALEPSPQTSLNFPAI